MKPIFETNYLGSKIEIYPTRVIFSLLGQNETTIPMGHIASVNTGLWGVKKVIIETTGGRTYEIPCWHKKEVRDAIYNEQDKNYGRGI